ncbi:MAG: aminoglycoside phosphotransferase family protein [Propionibacteriales bacterium]|nr:aminoglycoside phosphotransferase family protein [Propionibacteriales bacterium]
MAVDWFGTPMVPLPGGYSGETFLVGDGDGALVLRIYRRSPERGGIDASLLRLVRGIIPVPAVVEIRRSTGDTPAILVVERLRGVSLDRVLHDAPSDLDVERLATSVGRLLGLLSGIPFLQPGFFTDTALRVGQDGMAGDLGEWAHHHRVTGRLASWSEQDWRALLGLVDDAQRLLDGEAARTPGRTVLAHSDFNPKNILVDPVTCEVTGLVDWEFAHAGSVYTDVGNFTRFERDERLVGPLVEAFVDQAPGCLVDPIRLGRAMDLWALLELASRPAAHPVAAQAARLLLAQARAGDLAAWPWQTPRVDPAGAGAVS